MEWKTRSGQLVREGDVGFERLIYYKGFSKLTAAPVAFSDSDNVV